MISLGEVILILQITVASMLLLFFRAMDKFQDEPTSYLEISLGIIILYAVMDFLFINELFDYVEIIFPLYYTFLTSFAPLIYLHFKKLSFKNSSSDFPTNLKYFILPAFVLMLQIFIYLPLEKLEKLEYMQCTINFGIQNSFNYWEYNIFFSVAYYLQVLVFWGLLIKLVSQIKQESSGNGGTGLELNLIKFIKYFVFASFLFELVLGIVVVTFQLDFNSVKIVEHSILIFYALFIGFIGNRQLYLRLQYRLALIVKQQQKKSNNKLLETDYESIKNSIEKYLSETDMYQDPNFSLKTLSLKLHIPAHKISNVINFVYGVNFKHLINEYRIGAAKKLIMKGDSTITIDEIFSRVGFYSKSNFYKTFKDITGLTPKEFKKQIQKN